MKLQTFSLEQQDISSSALICTYEATKSREYIFSIYVNKIDGNGVYRICCTKELNNDGSIYVSPTSAVTVGMATSLYISSIVVPAESGDVIKFYMQGSALDTAVDIKVEVYDTLVTNTVVDSDMTLLDAFQVFLSVLAGKASGGETNTIVFRDLDDTINRVTMTVDRKGNRTEVIIVKDE